jgi:hypothetical protein
MSFVKLLLVAWLDVNDLDGWITRDEGAAVCGVPGLDVEAMKRIQISGSITMEQTY